MKNLFILSVIIMLLQTHAQAQRLRFIDTSNVWIVCNKMHPDQVAAYGIKKDSVINGKQYHYAEFNHAWMREDTIGPKYYYFDFFSGAEALFVDFSLQESDSMSPFFAQQKVKIPKVDSILINGLYHKVISIGFLDIIEGIGPQYTVLGPAPPEAFYAELCCFVHKGARVSMSPVPQGMLYNCALSVEEVKDRVAAAGVIPNPATLESRIVLPRTIETGKLKILNTAGQFVVNASLKHAREIPLREYHLPPGFYFFIAKDAETGKSFQGKFTVQ
jgi:hypothetical protein